MLTSCKARIENPTTKDIANQQNEYFTDISNSVTQDLSKVNSVLPETVNHSMLLYRTNFGEVYSISESLENKFSSDDDELDNVIVRTTSNITVPYKTDLINQSLSQGTFPDILKKLRKPRFIKRALKQTRKSTGQYHTLMFEAKILKGLCTIDFTHTSKNLSFSITNSVVLGEKTLYYWCYC